MRVKARFTGIFRHYAGEKERDYELPEGSKVSDLLLRIGREFSARLPENMWDAREERFHPLIKVGRKGTPFADDEEELRDGDEVFILSRMAGG
ncbi:MAG: MoaD/ThiS family protein [Actinomycetota bacterium]|nr:MoaD/ThiS family protein [Actinomycetota bacterium]MDD5667028.1 MoaD/ThiS family protein [Actinomycetota bacterium]